MKIPNVHSTLWPDYDILEALQIRTLFDELVSQAGLVGYVNNEVSTFVNLTRDFMSTFNYSFSYGVNTVSFRIYDQAHTMLLDDLCDAMHVSCGGSVSKLEDRGSHIADFLREISDRTIPSSIEGKLSGIQHPALCYLSYFIARSFTGKYEHTVVIMHDLYILMCVIHPEHTWKYNLGAICARHIKLSGSRSYDYYCGVIATLCALKLNMLDITDDYESPGAKYLDEYAFHNHKYLHFENEGGPYEYSFATSCGTW